MNFPKTNFTVGWAQTFDPHCINYLNYFMIPYCGFNSFTPAVFVGFYYYQTLQVTIKFESQLVEFQESLAFKLKVVSD